MMAQTARYQTIHFGVPDPAVTVPPETRGILFRWRKPRNWDDVEKGHLGTRSGFWQAGRAIERNSAGADVNEFLRKGDVPAEVRDVDDWGM